MAQATEYATQLASIVMILVINTLLNFWIRKASRFEKHHRCVLLCAVVCCCVHA